MKTWRTVVLPYLIPLVLFATRIYANDIEKKGSMIMIPAKNHTFSMGDVDIENASPVHQVTFTYDFFIDSTEVTQEDYQKVMGTNPALYKKPGHPVENVTWYEALLYCNERSKRDNLDTVYSYSEVNDMGMMDLAIDTSKSGYRLPTEAEWEYTCKANSTTNFYWGDTINNEYCHYEGTKDENSTITIVVASKRPNAFGIYDMSGNVWEYVNDMMQTYKSENRTNPLVWTSSASLVVVRGGSHEDKEDKLQSGYREGVIPFYKDGAPIYGFRVVLPKREPVRIETRRTKLPVDNNCASLKIFTIRGQYIGTINPTRFHKNKSRANGLYIGKYKATHKKLIDIIY